MSSADLMGWMLENPLKTIGLSGEARVNFGLEVVERSLCVRTDSRGVITETLCRAMREGYNYVLTSVRSALSFNALALRENSRRDGLTKTLKLFLHTSGTTGDPVWCWRTLEEYIGTAASVTERLKSQALEIGREECLRVVSSVPPNHMFGLEFSVVLPWLNDWEVCEETVLMPDRVVELMRGAVGGSLWVTTPSHIRAALALLDEGFDGCQAVISATMPIPIKLCRDFEDKFGVPVIDVYGSTETGAIGMRRLASFDRYLMVGANEILEASDRLVVRSVLSGQERSLLDEVELLGEGEFRLIGRSRDILKVNGLRVSTQYLRQLILEIPGIHDCEVILLGADATNQRLTLVYSGDVDIDRETLLRSVMGRLSTAFVPKIIVKVEEVPRNELGKPKHLELESLCHRFARYS